MRCTGIIWAVVILTVASTYTETHDGEHSDDTPTVQECRSHIEAAIRLYQSGELGLDNPSAAAETEDENEQDDDGPIHNVELNSEDSNEPQDDEGELEQHREQQEDEQGNTEDGEENDDDVGGDADDDEDQNENDETDENDVKDEPKVEDADEEDDDGDIEKQDEIFAERTAGEDDENEVNTDADDETKSDEAVDAGDEEADKENDETQDDETDGEQDEEPSEDQDDESEIPENETEESESLETAYEPEATEGEVPEESTEHIQQNRETDGSDDDLTEDDQPTRETREERSTDTEDDDESETIENADQQHTQVGEDNQEDDKTSEEIDDGEELVQTQAEDDEHVVSDTTKVEEEDEADEAEEEEVTASGPGTLRTRDHIEEILHLDDDGIATTAQKERASAESLRNLKRMYEATIKPLEGLYKFKDISNRHLGDAELFSQPIVVFFGPLGSGKSTIVNYLLGIEDTHSAIKTGTDPNSNFFNVLMHGDSEQIIDGTQLAADWAFSSLQKFGQSFLDKLRGRKLPNALLRKVTVVDTPGISEHRKSNERLYPFNDVCQWFIDRADLIFVVFDPSKLDIGMELEALFDQLKGRESHVRLLLNKADTVSPVELLRAQSSLLWNLSPLVGTPEPPTVFAGSFWSRPYIHGSAAELLYSSEVALLEDIQEAVENRVENKVALARRHAVRVRNHAKMVDCYLNTYYNHKSFFSNKRKVADEIIDNPHMYRIYEGLSTLANVSRYDLPDPDVYRDFFRLNPLFDFKPLSSTCSYFKGCPLDKLDITIAYDLPELVGKYQKALRALGVH